MESGKDLRQLRNSKRHGLSSLNDKSVNKRVMEHIKKHYIQHAFYLIFFISLALRLWGIWNVSTTDEYNEVIEGLRVCSGHFNFERWFKRFYLYVLAMEYGIYYGIGWLFNAFSSPMDFAEKIVRHMEPLFILGRLTSAIAGALTVGMLYRIGNKFFNHRVAVISSLFLALTVFHIDLSQQAKVDATLGLLVVITFYFIMKILSAQEPNRWVYSSCGFFMALAMQTKLNSIVLIVPFAIAVLYNWKNKAEFFKYYLWFFTGFFVLGFIIGNPPVLLAPLKFLKSVLGFGKVYTTPINVVPNDLIGFLAYPLYYFRSMGTVVSLLTILAVIHALFNLNKRRTVLLAFIAAFYILMGASKYMIANYYMIPAVPFIYLLIGDFFNEASKKFVSTKDFLSSKTSIVFILILIVALIRPTLNVAYHELSLSGKNTRYLAKEWIEANIPFRSKILMDSGKSINSFAPLISENRESLERILKNVKQNVSKGKIVHGMVDRNALIYYELLLKTVHEKSYDITSTMFGLDVQPIDYYIANKYEYFIISNDMKRSRTNDFFAKRNPEIAGFYKSLNTDKRIKLIKTISPTSTNRGDTFYIYEVM